MSWLFRKSRSTEETQKTQQPSARSRCRNASHVVLLLGQATSGKSTLINYLTNFFKGGSMEDPLITVPNQYYPATEATVTPKNGVTVYGFNYQGQQYHFIDSPGFKESRTFEPADWDRGLAGIRQTTEQTGALTAVIVTIDGRASTATANLHTLVSRLRHILPVTVVDNLIVLLTNCNKATCNFDFKTFDRPWEINPDNVFMMDNSAFSYHPDEWRTNPIFHDLKRAWYASMEQIKRLVLYISDLDIKTRSKIPDHRDKITEEIHELLLDVNKIQHTQDKLENVPRPIAQDIEKYGNFKEITSVEYAVLMDADKHNRICLTHTDGVCHDDCLPVETVRSNTGFQRKCHCTTGQKCRLCGCDHMAHYCAKLRLRKERESVAAVLQELRNDESSDVRNNKPTGLVDDLHVVHKFVIEKQLRIEHFCYRLKTISADTSTFDNQMFCILEAMESKARALASTNARQDAYAVVQSTADLIVRMNESRSDISQETDLTDEKPDRRMISEQKLPHHQQITGTVPEANIGRSEAPSVCLRFNKNMPCDSHPCLFRHQCFLCNGIHSAMECRANAGSPSSTSTQLEPPPPYSERGMSNASNTVDGQRPFLPGACRYHNHPSGCKAKNCKFAHICGYCSRGNHTVQECRADPSETFNPSAFSANRPVLREKGHRITKESFESRSSGAEGRAAKAGKDTPCRYYNSTEGCRNQKCTFAHKCSTCGKLDHGADNCKPQSTARKQQSAPERVTQQRIVVIQSNDVEVVNLMDLPKFIDGSCYSFNRGKICKKNPCPYKHLCGICGQLHSAIQHPGL